MARMLASALLLSVPRPCSAYNDDVFDCDSLDSNAWSMNMRVWCCNHRGKGCDHDGSYDCQTDLNDWERGWSRKKKAWCCSHENKACQPYDCDAGWTRWHTEWTTGKIQYCCHATGRGCDHAPTAPPPPAPTTTLPFDCSAGYARWETGWSPEKKAWCCSHVHKGCQPSTTITFDCSAGFAKWETGWSDEKKDWCCLNEQKACKPFDCGFGLSDWHHKWSDAKREWCCMHELDAVTTALTRAIAKLTVGIPANIQATICPSASTTPVQIASTTSATYDCSAGVKKWKTGWSQAKKDWCCTNEGFCGAFSAPAFDCNAGIAKWRVGWSDAKKEWCCSHEKKGCTTFYNCDKDFDTWMTSWTSEKKEWCCKHRHCVNPDANPEASTTVVDTTTEIPPHPHYDCSDGIEHWQTEWPSDKYEWCCMGSQGHSCPSASSLSPTTTPFDCGAGVDRWETGWSDAKKDWCCKDPLGPSCPTTSTTLAITTTTIITTTTTMTTTTPFDCEAGVARWRTGWSDGKKEWCCQNYNSTFCHPDDFNCNYGYEWLPGWFPLIGWTSEKRVWCCEHADKGCEPEAEVYNTTEEPEAEPTGSYKCDNAMSTWTVEQGTWCCENENKGCTTTTVVTTPCAQETTTAQEGDQEPYNCSLGIEELERGWSEPKKQWCCAHANIGCQPFDCGAGQANWKRAWSDEKKDYCCKHGGVSCPDAPQVFSFSGPHLDHVSTNVLLVSLLVAALTVPLLFFLVKTCQTPAGYNPPQTAASSFLNGS